ncbi:MAG TPA: hypothetical protein VLH86_05705 [Patescibacteria group bacterium]|nr:hypothetical protein [Patescibacteria group bacterium]
MPKKSKAKSVLVIISIIVLVAIGAGSYYWQHSKVDSLNSKVVGLQEQLKSAAEKASTPTQQPTTSSTFTYSPKTGGLTLTLAKKYGIIVNVDGNKGGAPGATFRVASVINANNFSDGVYQGVQVDVDNTFTNLDHAVSAKESELTQANAASGFKVSDTTVAGLPAKLITADGGDEYVGGLSYYIVGSGSFEYTVTANGTKQGPSVMLTDVLKSMSIKAATL